MICWHCGTQLVKLDDEEGEIFEIVTDPIGNEHKVHKMCAKAQVKPITARPSQKPFKKEED